MYDMVVPRPPFFEENQVSLKIPYTEVIDICNKCDGMFVSFDLNSRKRKKSVHLVSWPWDQYLYPLQWKRVYHNE